MINSLNELVDKTFGGLTAPEQIANLCREKQIQGYVGNSTSCPMVKLLREQFPFPIGFAMGKKIGTGVWFICGYDQSIPSPDVCDRFVDDFDLKKYPDLIAWGEHEQV